MAIIEFPKYFDSLNFEKTVLKNFNNIINISKETEDFYFDLSKVLWIDLFSLTSLVFLLEKASRIYKRTVFICPICHSLPDDNENDEIDFNKIINIYEQRQKVCSFLERWSFFKYFQEKENIIFNPLNLSQLQYDKWSHSHEDRTSFVLELTNINSPKNLHEIRNILKDKNKLKDIFKDFSTLNIIESGTFSNVLVNEIGSNINIHANASTGILTIHIVKNLCVDDSNTEKRSQYRIRFSNYWEQDYFKNRPFDGYIEIFLGDNGDGIFNTLKESYSTNFKTKSFKEVDVLEWAFEEYSSKNIKKRDNASRTGLFWVLQTVKENFGLISLRSSNSLVCFDFSNKLEFVNPIKIENLDFYQGTQLKIFLPLNERKIEERSSVFVSNRIKDKRTSKKEIHILNLKDIALDNNNSNILEIITKTIENKVKYLLAYKNILFINFYEIDWDKELLNSFFNILYSFGQSRSFVLINFDSMLIPVLKTTAAYDLFLKSNFILPIICNNLEIIWIGVSSEIWPEFQSILSNGFLLDNEIPSKFDKNKLINIFLSNEQLFKVIKQSNQQRITSCLSVFDIDNCLKNISEKYFLKILESNNAIKKGYFYILPQGYYSKCFIDLNYVFEDPIIESFVITEITKRINLKQIKIDIILTCNQLGKHIASLIKEACKIRNYTYFKYSQYVDSSEPVHPLTTGKNVLILTLVIGSGNQINHLLNYVNKSKCKTVGICALIDTRFDSSPITNYEEIVLVKYPFKKHNELPIEWENLTIETINTISFNIDINIIDRIIKDNIIESNQFWKILDETNSFFKGHFENNNKHYSYYVDTANLFRSKYRNFFINKIVQILNDENIEVIVYPSESNIKLLLSDIRLILTKIQFIRIERKPSLNSFEYIFSENIQKELSRRKVLLLDDGANSGNTITSIMNILVEHGAKLIRILVLINRLSVDKNNHFYQLQYSIIPVKFYYFYWLNFPVYHKDNCPYCLENKKLSEDVKIFTSQIAQNQIQAKLKRYSLKKLNEISFNSLTPCKSNIAKFFEKYKHQEINELIDELSKNTNPLEIKVILSLLNPFSESIIYNHFRHKLDFVCVKFIKDNTIIDTSIKNAAMKILVKINPDGFVNIFPELLTNITSLENNYYLLLQSCIYLLNKNINKDILYNIFEEANYQLKENNYKLIRNPEELIKINNCQQLLIDFRNDLEPFLPQKQKESLASQILYLSNKLKIFEKPHHIDLLRNMDFIKGVLRNIVNEIGGDKKMYVDILVKDNWLNQILISLQEIIPIIQNIFYTQGISHNNYFIQSENSENVINDFQTIKKANEDQINWMNDIHMAEVSLKNTYEAFRRIHDYIYSGNISFRHHLLSYFPDINNLIDTLLDYFKPALEKNNFKVILNKNDKIIRIFFASEYLKDLIHNLINDSIKNALLSSPKGVLPNNIINIVINQFLNHVELIFENNGSKFDDDFTNYLANPSKTWAKLLKIINRFNAKLAEFPQKGDNMHIKILFKRRAFE